MPNSNKTQRTTKKKNDGNDSDDNVSNNLFNQTNKKMKWAVCMCVCTVLTKAFHYSEHMKRYEFQ